MQCEYKDMEEFLESLTINPKYFDGDTNVSHKLEMEETTKGSFIWNSEVNEDLVQIRNCCE